MKDLTQGSVMRHLVHMAAFLAVSMAVQTLYLLADLYWVGHLGKEAIAAVGVAGNLMMLTQALGVGTTTLISHAAGQKDQPRAELVFNQSFTMSILVGLALGVCGFFVRTVYCDSLSADAITAELAKKYLLWFIPSLALQFPLVALGSALRATGVIKPAVGFPVLSVLLNIALAPLLIFGIGPWPRLGVIGAALATFISILIADILIVIYFEKKYHYLRFRLPLLRPQIKIWRQMLAIGVPAGAEFVLLFVYILVVYAIIRGFGPAAQAGFGVGASSDASALPAGSSTKLCRGAGRRSKLRRPSDRSRPPVSLCRAGDCVRDDVHSHFDRVSCTRRADSSVLARSACRCVWRTLSKNRIAEFRGCRNRLYRFQCVPRNRQYPAAVAQLNNTPDSLRVTGAAHFAPARI